MFGCGHAETIHPSWSRHSSGQVVDHAMFPPAGTISSIFFRFGAISYRKQISKSPSPRPREASSVEFMPSGGLEEYLIVLFSRARWSSRYTLLDGGVITWKRRLTFDATKNQTV
jgi:hypothetical protein